MSRVRIVGLILAGLLTACSSTTPQSASSLRPAGLPTVTPAHPTGERGPSATPTAPPTPTPGEGPITESMAKFKIDGERYATLGQPDAQITVVEFSDYG
ncbi:MAG TPA: hypothetical protein VFZ66_21205 [Herpetosiphonaceae bacterium]